jgi:uncharacterized protein (TIGR04222 family)
MHLNPFHWSGPKFLVFYTILGSMTVFLIRAFLKRRESQLPLPGFDPTDPHEIAYLRGGEKEALAIGAFSLIDRGLLAADGDVLHTRVPDAELRVRRPLEKAILVKFKIPQVKDVLFSDSQLKGACRGYRSSLGRHCLIATEGVFSKRRPMIGVGLMLILGIAGFKIFIAISQGKHNVFFLIALALCFSYLLVQVYRTEKTGLGDRILSDLKTLFSGLNDRASRIKPGGEPNEAVYVAAIFGFSALSQASFPYLQSLWYGRPIQVQVDGLDYPELSLGDDDSDLGGSCGGGCSACTAACPCGTRWAAYCVEGDRLCCCCCCQLGGRYGGGGCGASGGCCCCCCCCCQFGGG